MEENNKLKIEISVPGISELGETSSKALNFAIDGAKVFLNATCRPALEELGVLFRDQVSQWKIINTIKFFEKVNGRIQGNFSNLKLHPKLAINIIENASLEENDSLQNYWAGLLINSLAATSDNDENLLFIPLIKSLTIPQVRLLNFSCLTSYKRIAPAGLVSEDLTVSTNKIKDIMRINDPARIIRELQGLKSNGLLRDSIYEQKGNYPLFLDSRPIFISVSFLGLQLYCKCNALDNNFDEFVKNFASAGPGGTQMHID